MLRRSIALLFFIGLLGTVALTRKRTPPRQSVAEEAPAVTISSEPMEIVTHSFDPEAPPADMPPLRTGETAECDSNFLSSAIVRGETRRQDGTHATLTVTQVKVTLQLKISLWLPDKATEHLVEHEQGHRQISEATYQSADAIAKRIAGSLIGRQVELSGTDLDAESRKALHELATEVTDRYNQELNPNPPQLLYDSITQHSRNDVVAKDAAEHALKNATVESAEPGK